MNHIIRLVLLCFFCGLSLFSSAQKKIIHSEDLMVKFFLKALPDKLEKLDLPDLRKDSSDFSIRIWNNRRVISLSNEFKNKNSCLIYSTKTTDLNSYCHKVFDIDETLSIALLDSIKALKPLELEDESRRGLDGSFTFIELSTKNIYKIITCWSPYLQSRSENIDRIRHLLEILRDNIGFENLDTIFLDSLEPGNYLWGWGISTIRIDRFLDEEIPKTDLYKEVEQKLKLEFDIKNNRDFPLILINDLHVNISNLNLYSKKDVIELNIYKSDNPMTSVYPTSVGKGVITVKIK